MEGIRKNNNDSLVHDNQNVYTEKNEVRSENVSENAIPHLTFSPNSL